MIVHDGTINSDPATVTISTVNSKPIAHPGPDQHGVVGATITLNGSGSSDVDGDLLTYQWSLTSKPATSTATLQNPTNVSASFVLDKAGTYTAQLIVNDGTVDSDPVTVTITTLNSKPVANAGPDQNKLTGQTVTLNGNGSSDIDGNPLTYFWSLSAVPQGSTAQLSGETTLTSSFVADLPGLYVVQLIVNDGQLDSDPDTVTITVTQPDTTPPPPANLGSITLSPVTGGQVTLTGSVNSVEGGATVTLTNLHTNQSVTVTAAANGSFTAQLGAQNGDGVRIVVTDGAGNASPPATLTVEPPLPPDPSTVAPAVDRTIATTVADSTAFLYSGPNPIQTGVAPGTIEAKRAAIIRGKVLKKDNSPLSGVTITILNHPELGQTHSRTDGMFDMAVNGGGLLTVNYAKPGYLPAQRQVEAPWQDYARVPDVVLIQPDPQVTTIDLTSSAAIQVAAGSPVTDSSGTRQAVVMIPQGTTATMTLPNGTTQPLTTLNVRLTEYTVSTNGPQSMPATLPPSSGYTYAFNLTADEALAPGATELRFSQPIPLYVDNFLTFPTGAIVPVGDYNGEQGTWIPETNGKVIKVLSVSGGVATIDSNNDNVADDAPTLAALGISLAEQQQLAQRYPSGKSLWRARTTFFRQGKDLNWPYRLPSNAVAPNGPDLAAANAGGEVLDSEGAPSEGIDYLNQALGKSLTLTGTPFALNYRSSRSVGRANAYTVNIPLSGATVPSSLRRIDLTVEIAGQVLRQSFPAQPNLTTTYTWDGKDAYGRLLQGQHPVEVTIEFVYQGTYFGPPTTGTAFGQPASTTALGPAREDTVIGEQWSSELGIWDMKSLGLAGWSLAPHHAYDPIGRTLYFGDGSQRSGQSTSSENLGTTISRVAGGGTAIPGNNGPATAADIGVGGFTIAPDGSVYISDTITDTIRKVNAQGVLSTIAGTGVAGFSGDGGPATAARFNDPGRMAMGPDGSLYVIDGGNRRVRKITPSGIITTVAGNGALDGSGDNIVAVNTAIGPRSIAVTPDDTVYIAEAFGLRRVGTDGRITTMPVPLNFTAGSSAGTDGSVYIADQGNDRVVQLGRDGIVRTVAGGLCCPATLDGVLATSTYVRAYHVFPKRTGGFYLADTFNGRVRLVGTDGILRTLAAREVAGFPTWNIVFGANDNPWEIVEAPDGTVYFAVGRLIFRLRAPLPGFSAVGDMVIAAKDGSEAYVFSPEGRHLRTVNTLTTSVIYSFTYDSAGRLSTVTDANTNVTTITRDGAGNVTGITGPYGQSNTITLDANGNLASITNPNGETTSFSYAADGLLTSATPPGKPASTFQYDSQGRLLQTSDPAGGGETLTRTNLATGYQVTSTTTGGQASTYKLEYLADGQQRRTNTMPDGTVETTQIRVNGSQVVTQADGITQTVSVTGDPRFGLQSPMPTSLAVTTPGGKNGTLTNARTVNLSDPNNPLSLTSQTDTVSFNGRNATRTYNATTRTSTETSPAGQVRTTTVDPQGRVSQQQQGTLAPTAFSYDARGRLASRSQGGRSTSLTYDPLGRPQTITDSASRTVQFQYDSAGRVTQQTLPDNRVITYSYDGNGNVTSITPPGRPAHTFTYTPVDLEKDYLAPAISGGGTNTTTYSYNADKQVTGITRPDGQQIALTYSGGKLSSQSFPSAQSPTPSVISYGYNAQGNLSAASFSGGGTVNYTYDGSLLLSSTWSGPVTGSVTWTYDNNYRKTSQSVNGGNTITFTYDNDDLLTGAGAMSLTRDAQNGLLTGTTLGTTTETMTYNSLGEVATSTSSISGSPILSATYARDSLGRISTKTETIQGTTTTYGYTYDTAGRLTEVKHDGNTIATYSYDANSNRLSKTGPTGTQSGTYDDQDRLLTYNGTSYSYTANGELSSKSSTQHLAPSTYSYDALGNLRSATLPNGTTVGYVIDGEDRRVGKTVNGTLVQGFLYENQLEPVAELDGSGNLISRFVYCGCGAGNIPQYMVKNGVTYRIISDHLGSPRLVVDVTSGAIVQRMDYDEFGTVILDTNPGFQPFGFAGGIYDRDTGLTQFGVRDYDPETGRWTAKDPIGFRGLDSNLYGYVFNDPINAVDLDGQLTSYLVGAFIGGVLRGAAVGALTGAAKSFAASGGNIEETITGAKSGLLWGGLFGGVGGIIYTLKYLRDLKPLFSQVDDLAGIGPVAKAAQGLRYGAIAGFYGNKYATFLGALGSAWFSNEQPAY